MDIDINNLSDKQIAFIDLAIKLAKEGREKNNYCYAHGAIAVSNGRVLSKGINHPRTKLRDRCVSSFHAEVDVLSKVLRGTSQDIYTSRVGQR